MDLGEELALRERIFIQLADLVAEKTILQRRELEYFELDGNHFRIADRSKGIWNPKELNATLSILSTPDSSYPDIDLGGGLFAYAYRDGSKDGDNLKLRKAFELQLPVIWHRGFKYKSTTRYVPVFPVHIVEDDIENRRVIISLERELPNLDEVGNEAEIERRYTLTTVKRRLHQREFRGRLLVAYQMRCAVCRMNYPKLLDGAHITADNDPDGIPSVDNGLALCKIHHAAYDAGLMGISPDYKVHISDELKEQTDSGPIILHGFHKLEGHSLACLPKLEHEMPSRDRLEERFQQYESNNGVDVAWTPPIETNL